MPTKRALAVLLAAALVVPVAAITSTPAATAPAVTFGSPVIVDPIHTFGEPDVRIHGDDVYVSGPWGTGTQRSIWDWSHDGGQTFRTMHSSPIATPDQSATTVMGPGGGDTEISIDHTGKVYYSDLAALTTLKMATWDPNTHTMQTNTLTNVQDMTSQYDRQWFALWDPPNVTATRKASGYTGKFPVNYLTWNGNGSSTSYSYDGINYPPTTLNVSVADDGPLVIDQLTGTVIQAIAPSKSGGRAVGVALRNRDPAGPSSDPALTKSKVIKAADLPKNTVEGALFTVIAIDDARNVYLVWCTQSDDLPTTNKNAWAIWYSYAPAAGGWTKWSKPVRLSAPPSRLSVMPWAVAGSKGRLAAVWYGTEDDKDDPSNGDAHQPWDLYLAMVTNADTAHPTVQQVKVTRHPMHYGTICFAGTDCIRFRGNRNMADFFEVTTDPATGAVVIVYDDTSNELVQTIPGTDVPIPAPIEGTADHRGGAVVTIARQNGGIGLFGRPIVAASAFGAGRLAGPAGNAAFDPVYNGSQQPALDARGVSMAADGSDLVFKVAVKSLADTAGTLSSLDAGALDYVVRWIGDPVDSPTGVRNPIYYAAAEVSLAGTSFFAGTARSTDLCSVSACTPHIIEYPAPPLGGTAVNGKLVHGTAGGPDYWEIRVPRDVVGSPKETSLFESLSAYTMVRNKPASLPTTNLEAEAGLAPVVVDGLCCVDTTIAASRPVVLGTKTTRKTTKNTKPVAKPAVKGGRLAATGVPGAPVLLSLGLIVGALVTRRVVRRV